MKVIKSVKLRDTVGGGYFTISLRRDRDGYYRVYGGGKPFETSRPTKSRKKAEQEFNRVVNNYIKKIGFKKARKRRRK